MTRQFMTVTETAAKRIAALMAQAPEGKGAGLRLGVTSTGCSGHSYSLDYAGEEKPGDLVLETPGGKVFVGAAAQLYLAGTRMDYFESDLESRFVFDNPNATGTCGCGKSFSAG